MGVAVTAADVAEVAAGHAAQMEVDRRLDPSVVAAVVAAGFARHFVPTAWGGSGGTFTELLDAVGTVARGCPSTAWFASLTAGLGRMAAYLPAEGQQALWRDGPDTVVVGALMPLGGAEPVDGGWRLRGQWPFVSGIDFADWALVCGMATAPSAPPQARFFLVRRREFGIADTWFNFGMQATGSNTLLLEETFVPAGHSFTRDSLTEGIAPNSTAAAHRVPLRAVNGLGFAAPMVGAARAAVEAWARMLVGKGQTANPYLQLLLARSCGEIDAASALLERIAAVADRGEVTPEETVRAWRDSSLAAELLLGAVDRLIRSAGTSAMADGSLLQRFWRDLSAAATHVVLRFDVAAEKYAGHLLQSLQTSARPPVPVGG